MQSTHNLDLVFLHVSVRLTFGTYTQWHSQYYFYTLLVYIWYIKSPWLNSTIILKIDS